jgi:peptidoglycan hydrolase-like protein with peptidoglycan-binding domain
LPILFGFAFLTIFPAAAAQPSQVAALDQDTAGGDSASELPWSAVVRDIQRELRDLGLYDGPLDGRYDAGVKAAIRRFEQQHGEIGDGAPLADALRRIVSVRDALHLRRNLNEIRERQTEQAARALRSNPATRDLIDPGRAENDGSATAQTAACGAAVTVDCLLAEARSAAAGIEQANFQDWALRDIILTEVRTGRGGAVRDRLRRLSDPRLVIVAMREVAEALSEAGRMEEALELAETIPDTENRIRATAGIAVSAAKMGRADLARRHAEHIVTMLEHDHTLASRVAIATTLASGLAQVGDIEGATYVIGAARNFASPATARLIRHAEIGMITGALADTGDFAAAVDALTTLAEEPASAVIASSASAVSRAAFAEGDRYRVTTLCNLAVVQAKAGNRKAAAKTLAKAEAAATRVRKGYPREYARFSLALAWARVGDLDKADASLATLANASLQAEGLWRTAEVAGVAGDRIRAEAFERKALEVAGGIGSSFDRAMMLGDMAIAAARADRKPAAQRIFGEALSAGRGVEAGWWRARAMARLATALHAVTGDGSAR